MRSHLAVQCMYIGHGLKYKKVTSCVVYIGHGFKNKNVTGCAVDIGDGLKN
jgi:hypothetical protein